MGSTTTESRLSRAESAFAGLEAHGEDGFAFLPGDGSSAVIVTAPHAVEHRRGDELRPAEPFTGAIACFLSDGLGCPAFVQVEPPAYDPNDAGHSPFRETVAAFAGESGASFLLDVHQMHPDRGHDLMIGTGEGRNVQGRMDIARVVADSFRECGIGNVGIDEYLRALGENRVASHVSRCCGIPCLQLELNSALVHGESERCCPERVLAAFERAVAALDGMV